jgi:SAM-dependent methyltransferase
MPRIHAFLPAHTVLEIAPGYGRFTRFLLPHCRRFIGVDVSDPCVQACRRRFADVRGARFFVNDGASLAVVPDRSVDFVFSFDSLVHADVAALRGYTRELARVLTGHGVAFLHHSNLGAYTGRPELAGADSNPHWRDTTTSAEGVVEYCCAAGLVCIVQELVAWGMPLLSDCFSVVTRPASRFARPPRRRETWRFGEEVAHLGVLAGLYAHEGEEGVPRLRRSWLARVRSRLPGTRAGADVRAS